MISVILLSTRNTFKHTTILEIHLYSPILGYIQLRQMARRATALLCLALVAAAFAEDTKEETKQKVHSSIDSF